MTKKTTTEKCAVIAIVGAPNAGKSTLTNTLVGEKISIVSPKVQTTRTRVTGIAMHGDTQLVLVDTPGIFKPDKRLDKAMVKAAWEGVQGVDFILLMIDATRGICKNTKMILEGLEKYLEGRVLLVLNKVDALRSPAELLPLSAEINAAYSFDETFMISATTADGTKELLTFLVKNAPEAPYLYPPEQISDLPERVFAAEITREKLFMKMDQEVPYSLMVETEKYEVRKPNKTDKKGSVAIHQVIYVERESQKKIIVGKGGANLKAVGESARKELSKLMGVPVHLFLFVKVREDWQDRSEHYAAMGLDFV